MKTIILSTSSYFSPSEFSSYASRQFLRSLIVSSFVQPSQMSYSTFTITSDLGAVFLDFVIFDFFYSFNSSVFFTFVLTFFSYFSGFGYFFYFFDSLFDLTVFVAQEFLSTSSKAVSFRSSTTSQHFFNPSRSGCIVSAQPFSSGACSFSAWAWRWWQNF